MTTSRRWILCAALIVSALPSVSAGSPDFGAGVALGEPIGFTGKLWLNDAVAVDMGAGLSDGNAAFWGDLLWHDWTLLPQPKGARFGAYFGTGPQVRAGSDARFGMRAIMGVSIRPDNHPLELFAEIGPLIRFTQGGTVDPVGGVGVRIYFADIKPAKKGL